VVEANVNVALLPFRQVGGQIFNIGSGNACTLLDVIVNLKKDFPDYNQPILFEPARAGDIMESQADITKYLSL
ncbi:MAG TPA: LPS biosynthesis protein WbpP, partial [Candidatus Babeliaceae bacterium]|nr:LPS biosynthesis protein WbpP [Candidatus Babeliaceae bacterium]